jgi:phosphonate transport system substrate-binding protein
MDALRNRFLGPAALVVALVALTLATFAVMYQRQVGRVKAETAAVDKSLTDLTGLGNQPLRNALDPRYTDADGDLVADPPTDPAKLIDPPKLTFCYVPSDEAAAFKAAFGDLMAAISKATGKPVEYVAYGSAAEELRAIRSGKLDIAGLNTGSVPMAVCTAGFVPLCQAADAQGAAEYQMKIIVPSDSTLSSLNDLRGHDLTLTEPSSNSGYRTPLVVLREHGMVPPQDYQVRFSNGLVESIEGVKEKRMEAAAVAGDVLLREQNAGHISAGDYKVIYTSDQTFPDAAIGCPHNLKPALVAQIKQAMLGFDWKGTGLEKLFAPEGKVKFIAADYKKSWESVRRIDESIGYAYKLPDGSDAPAASQPTTRMAMSMP